MLKSEFINFTRCFKKKKQIYSLLLCSQLYLQNIKRVSQHYLACLNHSLLYVSLLATTHSLLAIHFSLYVTTHSLHLSV